MAPLMNDEKQEQIGQTGATQEQQFMPRLLIIGAGSRGNSYARAVTDSCLATVVAVAEPISFKRQLLGSKYIWSNSQRTAEQEFDDYDQFIKYELQRRRDKAAGIDVAPGVDGVFICVRDEQHIHVLTAIAPLGLHIMSEKPLATTLTDCLKIEKALESAPERIFAIGHVLRYSPHNMLLRHLVREKKIIGDILSIEHTEPVGWWHFSHSYVRGNWRKESATAPSLLTKSCHDIDFILWMLCSPPPRSRLTAHLPARITSTGSLKQFRRSQKPKEAGNATNCLSCPLVESCKYSAPRIYYNKQLAKGVTRWPVDIVNPEIGTILANDGEEEAKRALMASLTEDYDVSTTAAVQIESRPWYGRCVWESDNDVCDDQFVTIEWDDEAASDAERAERGPKTASFHMIAQSLAQCERRGRIYGTSGEIYYDSQSITVHDFENETTQSFNPEVPKNSHHGGGDDGLTQQFIKAIVAASQSEMSVQEAQIEHLGCSMQEVIRSHAAVFAAEDARHSRRVVEWSDWWNDNVEKQLKSLDW